MVPPVILEETISFASRCFVTGFVSTNLSFAIAAVLIITGRILPNNEPMPCWWFIRECCPFSPWLLQQDSDDWRRHKIYWKKWKMGNWRHVTTVTNFKLQSNYWKYYQTYLLFNVFLCRLAKFWMKVWIYYGTPQMVATTQQVENKVHQRRNLLTII